MGNLKSLLQPSILSALVLTTLFLTNTPLFFLILLAISYKWVSNDYLQNHIPETKKEEKEYYPTKPIAPTTRRIRYSEERTEDIRARAEQAPESAEKYALLIWVCSFGLICGAICKLWSCLSDSPTSYFSSVDVVLAKLKAYPTTVSLLFSMLLPCAELHLISA
eukprot:gene663-7881_t